MEYIYYAFAALQIFFSYKSLASGIAYFNFFKSELARPPSDFTPCASIFAPCKGLENGLKENLLSLLKQNYPCYEVIFVVDYENDEAVRIIEEVSRGSEIDTQLVIAAKTKESSQKIENLREAVLHASEESRVFVFVDSDARPETGWLRSLVEPLENESIGAATGYRWFISKTSSLASAMLSVWNASIASALGPNMKSNFCWGGSMAIRRDIFERLDIRAKWKGSLSDDFSVTRAMNEANLPIQFVPRALTASIENCTFRELLEFTTRQMKITRVYAPKLWLTSFLGSGLFNIVMIWSLTILIFSDSVDGYVWAALAILTVVLALGICKSLLRFEAIILVLRNYHSNLQRQFWTQNTLWLLTPAVFFYNSFAALLSRKVVWRGTAYELISPTKTKVIEHSADKKS